MRACSDCEYLRTVNDPRSFTPFCIKHWKQVLLTSTCQGFKLRVPRFLDERQRGRQDLPNLLHELSLMFFRLDLRDVLRDY